ncbi:hypothetical protein [Pseudomonas sp. MWU12-2345]|uniref:hypothetical protein n=1 Tax=Pseudomonas sp. MWU12-2345 TaxID=2928689 RepID=UPI00200FC6BE|nr:hypothetical protein [Pseudomonas sp. MWU12-2345]
MPEATKQLHVIEHKKLTGYELTGNSPLQEARELRDYIFSTMSAGSPITKPYWFTPDTEFNKPQWNLLIPLKSGLSLTRKIDFNVDLYDGSNLLDPKNENLLEAFRYLIAYRIHHRYTGGQVYAPEYAYQLITRTLQIADWILLNGERFEICKQGLAQLNANSINHLLNEITILPTSEAIYNYSTRLTEWIKDHLYLVSDHDIKEATAQNELILDIENIDRELDLSDDELIKARVLFLKIGYYEKVNGTLLLRAKPILNKIYSGTFNGRSIRPLHFSELNIGEPSYVAEFPPVEVRRNEKEGASHRTINSYIQTFKMLSVIEECETGVDAAMLQGLTLDRVIAGKEFIQSMRYRTVPIEITLQAIRCSIEFLFENAGWILDAVHCVIEAKAVQKTEASSFQEFAISVLPEHILARGIRYWSVQRSNPGFYKMLRANSTLAELYQVLVGSIQIVTGAVMARRRDELSYLDSDNCLEPSTDPSLPENANTHYYLVFDGAKLGAAGQREELKRPLPRVAALFIWKLKEFNRRIDSITPDKASSLFRGISRINAAVTQGSRFTHYNTVNITCDYFQLPTIVKEGVEKRYYIRQHQLRRFFAIAFFWGTDNPDFETLSYMLGHTDAKLFYHYVTEHVTGRILREAKANRIQASLKAGRQDIKGIDELVAKLRKQFNAKQVHIKTYNEVFNSLTPMHKNNLIETQPDFDKYLASHACEGHVLDYLTEGKVTLEPDFFEVVNANGQVVSKFNLVLKVKDIE